MSDNEKSAEFPFMGGSIRLTPSGVIPAAKSDSGKDEPYQASVKVVGISKYPQRMTKAAIEKLLEVFSSEDARRFLQQVP